MPLDRGELLGWLRTHADHPGPLPHAIYTGLADRIERGDFDTKESKS